MFSWIKSFLLRKKSEQWIADAAIAGLQYYRANDLAELIKKGDALDLQRQPDNPYDEHAIIVLWNCNKIGYVPRALTRSLDRQIISGMPIQANIVEIEPVRFGRKWIKMRLQVQH